MTPRSFGLANWGRRVIKTLFCDPIFVLRSYPSVYAYVSVIRYTFFLWPTGTRFTDSQAISVVTKIICVYKKKEKHFAVLTIINFGSIDER